MTKLWNAGDHIVLRGVYNSQIAYAQSARVVKDTPEETILSIWPGAECAAPSGYLQYGHTTWDRWKETLTNTLQIKKSIWHTNRFLIFLEPKKFYSIIYIWDAASEKFVCYYINFQLPIRRTRIGFDTLDLDLDIVIEESHKWQWKDVDEYEHGIRVGGIQSEWIKNIEQAQEEVFSRIEKRDYPLDASWINWRPDSNWSAPTLPDDWQMID